MPYNRLVAGDGAEHLLPRERLKVAIVVLGSDKSCQLDKN